MPVSSHRAFFREHVNPKYEFPYRVGAIGPRPCELHSRWRRYAITSRDQLSSRKTDWFKHLSIEFIGGKYIWKVDGYFPTAASSPPPSASPPRLIARQSSRQAAPPLECLHQPYDQ